MKNYIQLLLIVILINGCYKNNSTIEKTNTQVSIPNWYINSPANTNANIYGIGEGETIDDAKNNALNNMSSKLLVNISSDLTRKKVSSSDGYYENNIEENLKVKVENIQYTNINVEKNSLINYNYYLLVKVDRIKLFKENEKKFKLIDNKLKNSYSELSNKSKVNQIIQLEKMKTDIVSNKKRAFILYAINNNFNYDYYLKQYDSYLNKIEKLKNSIKIKIYSNNTYYKDELIDFLNINNYKITNSNSFDIKIIINNKSRHSSTKGWNIAKTTTILSIHENRQILSNRIIETIGRSSSSKNDALIDSSLSFAEELKIMNVNKLLYNMK